MQTTSISDLDKNPNLSSKTKFYNLAINVLSQPEFLDELRKSLQTEKQTTIFFLNAHCFNVAQKNAEYMSALHDCSYLLNDGVGINIAGKLIDVQFKENLNGTDLIPEMIDFFAKEQMSIFCYGAKPEVITDAVEALKKRNPAVSVAGFSHGYVADPNSVVSKINATEADVVILGLGVPLQELWAANHASQLQSARVLIAGGAIFDFLSGNVNRAPKFLRRMNLEWLFRLLLEPKRLFSRYVLGAFVFLYNILTLRDGSSANQ